MSGISQHFKNASTLRKVSESAGAPLFSGQAWPSPALSQWAAMMLAACPTYLFTVYGDEASPGVADSATQAQIDTLLASGVPEANIRWEFLVGESVFVMAEMTSDTETEGLTLVRTAGIFAMAEMLSDSEMEGPTLVNEASEQFTMAEMVSDTAMDGLTLTRTAGIFAMAEMVSDTEMEGTTLQQAGDTNFEMTEMTSDTAMEAPTIARTTAQFTMAEMVSDTEMEAPTLSEDQIGFTDQFTGTNGDAPNAAYWDSVVDVNANIASGWYMNIQNNKLQGYIKATSGYARAQLPGNTSIPFSNGLYLQADLSALQDINDTYLVVEFQNAASSGDVNKVNFYIQKTAAGYGLALQWFNSSGTPGGISISATTGTDGDTPATFKLVLVDSTHIECYVGGVLIGATTLHTATLGTNVKVDVYMQSNNTTTWATMTVDNLTVSP